MEQDDYIQVRLDALAAFANAFPDALGRLRRENQAAFESALRGEHPAAAKKTSPRRPSMSILDFKRDIDGKNVLILDRWGERGSIVMVISSSGTGKSVVQSQMALSFAKGIPCFGLTPKHPFRSWIIQSEDNENRVATDRDDIIAELAEKRPDLDFSTDDVRFGVIFKDFTSFTGAKFISELERELFFTAEHDRPDCIFINPMNAYFGGSLKEGRDCSAFFKGGKIDNEETDGLEAIAKNYNVLIIIFAHTAKPPSTKKEQEDWLNDSFLMYKVCGANEITAAVRSVLVFLNVIGTDDVFAVIAAKNGYTLGWKDPAGNKTTKSYWRWAQSGRHFWEEVPMDEWPTTEVAKAAVSRNALESDVRELLSRMAAPGLNAESAVEVMKPLGIPAKRARAAYYEIVQHLMQYHVTCNVVPQLHGPAKRLYHTIDTPSATTPSSPASITPTPSTIEVTADMFPDPPF